MRIEVFEQFAVALARLLGAQRGAEAGIELDGWCENCSCVTASTEVIAGDVGGAVAAGELAAPVGDARVAPVLRSDLAVGIATVLLEDSHEAKGGFRRSWGSSRSATCRPARRVADAVGYARLADRLGLDVFALGEHHTPDYGVSSPAVVLAAAAAARTERIVGECPGLGGWRDPPGVGSP